MDDALSQGSPALTPELAPELRAAVRRIAGARSAWAPALHPSGAALAYVTDRSGQPRLEVAELVAGTSGGGVDVVDCAAVQQVSLPTQEVVSAAWSPDGEHLLYLVAPDGLIRAELHAVGRDGTGHRVLDGAEELETTVAGAFAGDGRYAYTVADGVGPGAAMRVVALQDGEDERPRALAPSGYQVVTSADAATGLAVVRRGRRGHRALWLVDLAVGGPGSRLLAAAVPEEVDRGEDGVVEHGGASVRCRTDVLPGTAGRVALVRVPLGPDAVPAAPRVLLARPDADLEAATPLPEGGYLCRWNVDGRTEVEIRHDVAGPDGAPGPPAGELPSPHWRPLGTGGSVPSAPERGRRLALPPGAEVVTTWSVAADGRGTVLEASGPALPRSLWWVGLPEVPDHAVPDEDAPGGVERGGSRPRPGTVTRLLGCTPAHDLPGSLVRPELQRYTAEDGLPLAGWSYRPAGTSGPVPVVLFLHGGPEGQERPVLSRTAQCLLAAGIGVFAPNVRGSDGYGARFRSLDDRGARWSSMDDVPATVDHVLRTGLAAPGAVGVHGWSYGGYLALASLCRWPDLFAAGSSLSGMSDLLTFFSGTETWMAATSTTEYGDPVEDAALLRAISPMTHLGAVRVPVMLAHGDRDTNVPLGESLQAHAALGAAGVPTELLVLPGEGHAVVGAEGVRRLCEALTSFFVRGLAGSGHGAVSHGPGADRLGGAA